MEYISIAALLALLLFSLCYLMLKLSDAAEADKASRRYDAETDDDRDEQLTLYDLRKISGELMARDRKRAKRMVRYGRCVSVLTWRDRINLGM